MRVAAIAVLLIGSIAVSSTSAANDDESDAKPDAFTVRVEGIARQECAKREPDQQTACVDASVKRQRKETDEYWANIRKQKVVEKIIANCRYIANDDKRYECHTRLANQIPGTKINRAAIAARASGEEILAEINAGKDECQRKNIDSGTVRIGMSDRAVRECGWGEPDSVNRTISRHGVTEQWVYPKRSNLYFENGILRTIQD